MSVPNLRFKQFTSNWEKKQLGGLITYTKGFAFKSDSYKLSGTRIVRVSDLTSSSIKQDNEMIFIDSSEVEKYETYKINFGDIVITTVGSKPELVESAVGRGILITHENEGFLNQNLLKINQTPKLKSGFLFRQINSERYINHIKNIQRGNANQSNITVKDLLEFEIYITELPEQTKIANFLTAVDEKIQLLTQKADLLAQYKKGLMQQIFSQELRFKDDDGGEFPEWQEKKLGDIAEKITAGATPSTLVKEYWQGEIRWMNSGELNLKRVYEVENRITKLGLTKSSTKLIPPKSILIGLAGQGKTRGTVAMNMVELCTNQSIAAIQPNHDVFDSEFLYQNLDSRYDELRGLSTGDGGRGGLNLQIIKSMNLSLPSLKEQTKIAKFLTAIDDKLTHTQTQLAAVKQYKQGLLQQMFV